MFTGIVTDIGTVETTERQGDLHVRVSTAYETSGIDLGASIACSGVCLTVVDKGVDAGGGWVAFDVSGETTSRTAPGSPKSRPQAASCSARSSGAMPRRMASMVWPP